MDSGMSPEEAIELAELAQDPAVKAAVLLRAFSIPSDIIEEVLSVSNKTSDQALKIPNLNALYSKWSVKIKELSGDAVFKRLLPLAVHVQERILSDETIDLKTRNAVGEQVISRVKGRPTQSVEVKSMNLNIDAQGSVLDSQIEATLARISAIEKEQIKLEDAKK